MKPLYHHFMDIMVVLEPTLHHHHLAALDPSGALCEASLWDKAGLEGNVAQGPQVSIVTLLFIVATKQTTKGLT